MWKLIYNLLIHLALPFFAAYSLTSKKIRTNFAERMFPAPVPPGSANRYGYTPRRSEKG